MNDDGEVEALRSLVSLSWITSSISLACFKQEQQTKLMFTLKEEIFVGENFHSRLCTPTHTGHRDWFGCPGVTAATELLNIR